MSYAPLSLSPDLDPSLSSVAASLVCQIFTKEYADSCSRGDSGRNYWGLFFHFFFFVRRPNVSGQLFCLRYLLSALPARSSLAVICPISTRCRDTHDPAPIYILELFPRFLFIIILAFYSCLYFLHHGYPSFDTHNGRHD